MQKSFALDTNVLLHDAEALTVFADNEVLLAFDVIEELDKFKVRKDDLGRHARQVIRKLDALREKGRLTDGVPIDGAGGMLRVALPTDTRNKLGLVDNADNRILSVAYDCMKSGRRVVFVSKDINARVRANALGLNAQDYEKQKVDFDRMYTGWTTVQVDAGQVDAFYSRGETELGGVELTPNQFVILQDASNEKHTALGKFSAKRKKVVPLFHGKVSPMGVRPRNVQQQMAVELLLSEDIELVTLLGTAGTGKTLLALACALAKVLHENRYDKVLVSRPIMPLGKDIGFLPGEKGEKLAAWMGPIFDNLKFILREAKQSADKQIRELQDSNLLELEAITYIRGRSIPRQYIIVDEAQNLTPHEVKTVVSRAGEDTKVVLTGDATQVDNPYLDRNSNGLAYTADRMKGQEFFGHVTLAKSERSRLASAAAELL